MPATVESLRDRFNSLIQANTRYVAIRGFQEAPDSVTDQLLILTDDLAALRGMLQLQSKKTKGRYDLPINQRGDMVEIGVVEKGRGLFPERFETSVLAAAVSKNGVQIPEHTHLALATLYFMLYREGWLKTKADQFRREILCDYVETTVGMMVAVRGYGWLENYGR